MAVPAWPEFAYGRADCVLPGEGEGGAGVASRRSASPTARAAGEGGGVLEGGSECAGGVGAVACAGGSESRVRRVRFCEEGWSGGVVLQELWVPGVEEEPVAGQMDNACCHLSP